MNNSVDNSDETSFGPLVRKMRIRELYLHAVTWALLIVALVAFEKYLYDRGFIDGVISRAVDDDTLKKAFNACADQLKRRK